MINETQLSQNDQEEADNLAKGIQDEQRRHKFKELMSRIPSYTNKSGKFH